MLDLDYVRSHFPSLDQGWVFMDNAGGSQILQPVLNRVQDYLLTSNVQLGASYEISQLASRRLQAADQAAATLINAADPSEVVMGPSTSLLLRILATSMGRYLRPGDEIIVTDCDHEANITPWLALQQQGMVIKTWQTDPTTLTLRLEDLTQLLSPRTKLVTLVHASNVLGSINPIRQIADLVHQQGAWLCVDGVGYAPHQLIDVQAMDVDFYVFSFYKVYGPHHALLYGKRDGLLALPGFNHDFIGEDVIPYKFQPGGANYELSYGTLGISDYLSALASHHWGDQVKPDLRGRLEQAFELMSQHETRLCYRVLTFLNTKPNVRMIGSTQSDRHQRVPTLAFTVEGVDSASIPPLVDRHHIALRYGHFYAKRLIDALGLSPQNGVVRISLVHYNTLRECEQLIECLDALL
ncbi:MAG: cysteine desulfurase-like protein [Cyanobacteria bacterium P01_G01_bin.38]